MREGWKEVKLEDISTKIGDGLHGTPKYSDDGEYYFINGNNLFNGKIVVNESTNRISDIEYFKIKKELTDRTILLQINGTIGNLAFYNGEKIALGKSACYINLVEGVNKNYIRYLLEFDDFQKYALLYSTGSTIKNLGLKAVRNYKFNLPPLSTQHRIAEILSGYDDLIENNLKRIKILEEMAQQTYEEWFVRMRFPGYESAIFNKETGLPEGWENLKLGEILKFINGFAFKSKDYVGNGSYSIVTIKNVQEGYFDNSKFDKILEIPTKVKVSQILKNGDLVMSLTGNVGRLCFIYGENLLLNQRVCKIQSDNISFVYCTLRSNLFKNKIENLANGAAQQNLSTIDMENLTIDFPSTELILDFERKSNYIFKSILNLNLQNQRLREARDILLPRLMMGIVEV